MSEFRKLRDICTRITDGSHYSPPASDSGYPMLSVKDMRSYDFDFSDCKLISGAEFEKMVRNGCVPRKNDVVIAKDGSYLKNVFVITEDRDIAVLSSIGILRPDVTNVDPYYLKYYLSSGHVKREVSKKYVTGSALPRIILENFGEIEIPIIPLESQKKIVEVLKCIDDKIANNNAIISELEAMAKDIYDYWFVQFDFPDENGRPYKSSGGKMAWNEDLKRAIPEGWDSKKLGDVFDVTMGSSPEGETINETGNGIVFYQGRTDFGVRYPSQRTFTTAPKRYAEAEDVLLSVRAPVGDINRALQKCCIGRGVAAIHSQWPSFSYYSCLFLRPRFAKYNDGGTTFGCINGADGNTIKQFELEVAPVDSRIRAAFEENVQLTSLRDWLLPMLMNGQVKVGGVA